MPKRPKKKIERPVPGMHGPMHPRSFSSPALNAQITEFSCTRCGAVVHLLRGGFVPDHHRVGAVRRRWCDAGGQTIGIRGGKLVQLSPEAAKTAEGIEARERLKAAADPYRASQVRGKLQRTSTSIIGNVPSRPGDVSGGLPGSARRH